GAGKTTLMSILFGHYMPDVGRILIEGTEVPQGKPRAAIRAGVGIGICQRGLARENPDLVHILPDAFSLPLGTWVAMHESLKSSPRCRATFDVLVKGLQDYLRYSTSA
ncbi:ATP-binding cassette domain-containing protein, partial [Rhizobium ruizarguesonis]